MSDTPFLLMIAGPNGSGKSTLTDYLISSGVDFGTYINPDEIAKTIELPEPARSRQAQQIADARRETCLNRRLSFSFETVMSHDSKIDILLKAHDAGYEITIFFVCTADPDINVSRVENRVSLGGHDVPHDRVVQRYWRTLSLLPHAALVADRTVLFDNTALVGFLPNPQLPNLRTGLRPVGEVTRDHNSYEVALEADVPAWVRDYLVVPLAQVASASEGKIVVTFRQSETPF